MPDMSAKASELNDPRALLARVAYRNERLLKRIGTKDDPVAYAKLMTGFNRTDLRRMAVLMGAQSPEPSA